MDELADKESIKEEREKTSSWREKMGGGKNPPATRLKCENIALYRMYTPWSTAFVGSAPFASIVKLFKGKYARRDQWFTH